jgi:hypothetical protein
MTDISRLPEEEQRQVFVHFVQEQLEEKRVEATLPEAEKVVEIFERRFIQPRYPRKEPVDFTSRIRAFGDFLDNSGSWISAIGGDQRSGGVSPA